MEALEIIFKINAPQTDYQSDINTLILMLKNIMQILNVLKKF